MTASMQLGLIEAFGYPVDIADAINAAGILFIESSEPTSIMLLGSAARGELSYLELHSHLHVLSDLEFMAVTDERVSSVTRTRVAESLEALETDIDAVSPLFHIDVLFRERDRLASLPPIVFTFEMKRNGRVLWGEDIRPLIPDVTTATLDIRNTNEILFKRLWAMLLHVPDNLLTGDELTELARMTFAAVCARNALDLSTVLLPHAGVLLPSYRERVSYLQRNDPSLPFIDHIDPDLSSFLQTCLHIRQKPPAWRKTLEQSTASDEEADGNVQFYRRTVSAVGRALDGVDYEFNERPISPGEALNLARLTLRRGRHQGLVRTLRWLATRRKQHLAAGLLAMHRAVLDHLNGKPGEANSSLTEAESHLKKIIVGREWKPDQGSNAPFAQRWFAARRGWAGVWCDLIRLGDERHRRRVERLLGASRA